MLSMKSLVTKTPACTCGHNRFRAVGAGKSRTGKRTFVVACLSCGRQQNVSKTAFALYNYLATRQPSEAFLNLYQLEQ